MLKMPRTSIGKETGSGTLQARGRMQRQKSVQRAGLRVGTAGGVGVRRKIPVGRSGLPRQFEPGKVWMAGCASTSPSPEKDSWIESSLNLTGPEKSK